MTKNPCINNTPTIRTRMVSTWVESELIKGRTFEKSYIPNTNLFKKMIVVNKKEKKGKA